MPHLMNCSHSADGWCLQCVKELWDEQNGVKTKVQRRLINLKNRYFRSVIAYPNGHLVHYGDCGIYRSVDHYGSAFCTCGFLADLQDLPESLREKLWWKFDEELAKEDGPPATAEQIMAARKMLDEWEATSKAHAVFDEMMGEGYSESWAQDKIHAKIIENAKEWALIEEIFGYEFRKRKDEEYELNVLEDACKDYSK